MPRELVFQHINEWDKGIFYLPSYGEFDSFTDYLVFRLKRDLNDKGICELKNQDLTIHVTFNYDSTLELIYNSGDFLRGIVDELVSAVQSEMSTCKITREPSTFELTENPSLQVQLYQD